LCLAIYIIFTGALPVILQAAAFGLPSGAGAEFVAATLLLLARDLLLLAPVLMLARHPLGVLHPLILTAVLWPVATGIPGVIEDFGGWAGVIAGLPVETPFYIGLPGRSVPAIWTAIAKVRGLEILSLLGIYAGFWLFRGPANISRIPNPFTNTRTLRLLLASFIGLATLVLIYFVAWRGGLVHHLTSLGRGRFRELAGTGMIMVAIDLGAIALYVWLAARPQDIKSPLFLACLPLVLAGQFISNGSRSEALKVPMIVGLVWAVRRQKIPWKMAAIIAPLLFVSIGLLGAIRTSSWSGDTASDAFHSASWSESLAKAQAEIAVRQSGSAQVPIVARGFALSGGPLMGETYLAAVVAAIPRSMWEGKPRGGGSFYAQLFFGSSREGLSIPLSPTVEMYWNFGLFGVVILSMLYGKLIRVAYQLFARRYPNPFAIVFYVLFVTTFRFESTGLVAFQQQCLLLLLCYWTAKYLTPRPTKRISFVQRRAPITQLTSKPA
jgi:oligosaccharide repeat unit polymerase